MKVFRLRSVIVVFLFLTGCSTFNDIEDLEKRSSDKIQLDSLIDYSLVLIQNELYDSAKLILQRTENLSIELRDTFTLSSTYNNRGLRFFYLGEFEESIDLYQLALKLNQTQNDSARIMLNYKNLGISFSKLGNYQKALSYYQQSLLLAIEKKDSSQIASINNSIGNTLNDLKRFDRSFDYFKKAEHYWQLLGDERRKAIAIGNLGTSLYGQGKFDEAITYHLKSLGIKREFSNESSISITLNNLGEAYLKKMGYSIARDYFNKSLFIREKFGETKQVAIVCNNLANLEIQLGQLTSALAWLDRALAIARREELPDIYMENLRLRKSLYAQMGDFRRAFEIDNNYDDLKEQDFNEQVVKVQELEIEQEESQKEAYKNQLELSEARRETQEARSQVQTYIIIVTILAVIIVSYFAYSLRKKNQHIENLIRELHHRVKNHLGMISGMFGAQTGLSIADTAVLDEAKTRVEAVNGIHRRLYRQDEYEFVNMHEYLEELIDNNALVFGLFNKIDKQLDISAQIMEIDKAISVGLIANEVLTNAFKYGLQETQKPVLKIVLEKVLKGYRMIIFNNASTDKSSGGGFGGELINRLTQNLKGQVQIAKDEGFQFELTFP